MRWAFRLHPIESGASICDRNRIMTGMRFLLWSCCVAAVWRLRSGKGAIEIV
jgi:hypothetical protein